MFTKIAFIATAAAILFGAVSRPMPVRGISEHPNRSTSHSRLVPTKCELAWLPWLAGPSIGSADLARQCMQWTRNEVCHANPRSTVTVERNP